jgi:hypothetical protein
MIASATNRRASSALLLLASLLVASSAAAQDPFEIQVYDTGIDEPGHFGLELHSNYVASGLGPSANGELGTDRVLHETLEPSFGVTEFLELGAYLQAARRSDGTIDFAGMKLRTKLVLPSSEDWPIHLGVNFELSWLPSIYDAARWGSEVRPILEWHPGPLVIDLNPILSFSWTGRDAGVPSFEPALGIRWELDGLGAIGLEYYGGTGPLSSVPPIRDQAHYLYEQLRVLALERTEIQLKVGEGLTRGSNGLVLATILGYEF